MGMGERPIGMKTGGPLRGLAGAFAGMFPEAYIE